MKHTPVPEIIKNEIEAAINIPGLQHIDPKLLTRGIGRTVDDEGEIAFYINGLACGVVLEIHRDRSMTLRTHRGARSVTWGAVDVEPETVKAAVIDALRAVVMAAA